MVPTIEQQAVAVERAAVNLAGHVDVLRIAVERHRRPLHELQIAEQWLPSLQAAAQTMRAIADEHRR